MQARGSIVVALTALGILPATALPAAAFERPGHFKNAQDATDEAAAAANKLSGSKKAEAHALVDDAKMLLSGAKHNHEKPQDKTDHARAIAKADSARSYAQAAPILAGR